MAASPRKARDAFLPTPPEFAIAKQPTTTTKPTNITNAITLPIEKYYLSKRLTNMLTYYSKVNQFVLKTKGVKMALYRAEVKPISRSKGHNAVAAAAYRAGEELTDKNKYNPNAMIHDYSKKSDIMHKNIILPAILAEQDFKIDRENLWSMVEEHEVTKKDKTIKASARVAREWLLALPHELSDSENIALAEEFATKMANDLGVIADCCIHHPKLKSNVPAPNTSNTADKSTDDDDERNIHAHIMFTTRKAELNATNQLIFTEKADSELDGTARKLKGLAKETDYIKAIRAEWAEMVNKRLSEHGIKAVSSLSYRERKLDILPQVHIGRDPLTDDKRERNNEVIRRNKLVFNSRAAVVKRFANTANASNRINELLTTTHHKFAENAGKRVKYSKRLTENAGKSLGESKQRVADPAQPTTPTPFADAIRRSRVARESATTSYDREAAAFDRASDDAVAELQRCSILANKWIGQRKHVVAQYIRNAELLNRQLLQKISKRNDSKNRIRWESGEKADDLIHSQKFDKRQQEVLEAFATEHNLDLDSHEDHYDFNQHLKGLANNPNFFKDNASIFEIVRNPGKERINYNARTLSESRQDVLSANTQNSMNEQSKNLNKADNELLISNNVLRPRF